MNFWHGSNSCSLLLSGKILQAPWKGSTVSHRPVAIPWFHIKVYPACPLLKTWEYLYFPLVGNIPLMHRWLAQILPGTSKATTRLRRDKKTNFDRLHEKTAKWIFSYLYQKPPRFNPKVFTEQNGCLDNRFKEEKNQKQSEERIANALPIPRRLIDHGEIFSPYILPPNTGISIPIPKDHFQLIVLTIDKTAERFKIKH